jgi:hypothetical protein
MPQLPRPVGGGQVWKGEPEDPGDAPMDKPPFSDRVDPVPDDRLLQFIPTLRTLPAIVESVDIAGLVAGASRGEGLGNRWAQLVR